MLGGEFSRATKQLVCGPPALSTQTHCNTGKTCITFSITAKQPHEPLAEKPASVHALLALALFTTGTRSGKWLTELEANSGCFTPKQVPGVRILTGLQKVDKLRQ